MIAINLHPEASEQRDMDRLSRRLAKTDDALTGILCDLIRHDDFDAQNAKIGALLKRAKWTRARWKPWRMVLTPGGMGAQEELAACLPSFLTVAECHLRANSHKGAEFEAFAQDLAAMLAFLTEPVWAERVRIRVLNTWWRLRYAFNAWRYA